MTVKDQKRGRPKSGSSQLSADKILDMAKSMMRESGKVPSIRGLATELGVDAMAIYHYFKNKNDLLESITVSLVGEVAQPQQNQVWQENLYQLSVSYLSVLNDYRGLLETLLTMKSLGPVEVFSERFEAVMSPLELTSEQTEDALHLLVDYLHGYALALNCNPDRTEITVEMVRKPLSLYCLGIEQLRAQ
ncbi:MULTISPECIES: TetR/AcrR family transcriptional regulator [unclassified Vibrio]|uniref:TetR/AcrR family transcriptional regulator n=1 Tax=unclassified Vibrio TaxID=2614977 RepID=UPI00159E8F8A|nr:MULTISPECIES: TetR/AcrR family transcriptional regulator [unclassified Vibrio]NVN80212.1 TetR/AcrR family transcriptional regulator [Vibrio sp. Scap16]QLE95968.1 TetR/AcrR family transcriptional regulator [Vibrio sp. Scap24]